MDEGYSCVVGGSKRHTQQKREQNDAFYLYQSLVVVGFCILFFDRLNDGDRTNFKDNNNERLVAQETLIGREWSWHFTITAIIFQDSTRDVSFAGLDSCSP